jgi:hypothetical protein
MFLTNATSRGRQPHFQYRIRPGLRIPQRVHEVIPRSRVFRCIRVQEHSCYAKLSRKQQRQKPATVIPVSVAYQNRSHLVDPTSKQFNEVSVTRRSINYRGNAIFKDQRAVPVAYVKNDHLNHQEVSVLT